MHWVYLAAAAFFEIVFAMGMKYAEGFTRPLPSAVTIAAALLSVGLLTMALKTMPVSVAYPMWTAIGTLGTVILGAVMLGESFTVLKVLSALAIVGGVAGLKVSMS
jgi:Membrane transporters of cations and cationic drugs